MRRRAAARRLATGALALTLSAVCTAPAAAFEKGSWMPAADLSALGSSGAPHVAVGADGTMIAVWARSDGGNSIIQAATRAPGGVLSDPIDLSDPSGTALGARVAIGPDGAATAVWAISRGADTVIEASTRPAGGTFGAAVTVGAANPMASPDVAVAPDGTTTVAWATGPMPGSPHIVRVATRAPGGAFEAPIELSGEGASSPLLAVAADGTATVAWNRSDGAHQIVQARTRPPGGGAFDATADLSAAGADALLTDIAAAADGTTTVVWTRAGLAQAATRAAGGSFGAAVDLSRAGEIATEPRVAFAGDGTTTVVWRGENADNDTNVQAATRPPGGAFAAAVDLFAPIPHGVPPAPPAFVYDPRIAAASDGTTTAMWTAPDGNANRVQASTRLPGAAFGTPVFLSTTGLNAFTPEVGMAPNGYATVVWSLSDGISRTTVQGSFTADAPIGRGALAITGTPALGSTLGCDGGRWIGATSVETGWLRGEVEVATGSSYAVVAADEGAALTCRGSASNSLGTTSRLSSPVNIPAAPPPAEPLAPTPPAIPAPAEAVIPAPPADIAAPAVAVLTKTRLTRRQFLAGVSVKLSADEPAKIVAELRGRASRSRTTGPYTRPLGSRTLFGVWRKAITIKLKPRAAAVGKARSFSVRLRLTVTDALGNRRITGKTIRVAG